MKTKNLINAAVILVSASALHAADVTPTVESKDTTSTSLWLDNSSDQLYRDYEISLEGFAVGVVRDEGRAYGRAHHGTVGAGAGIEGFFCRYIGIEAEGFADGTRSDFVDSFGGNLVLRWPIGETGFAPYIFGGAGHSDNPIPGTYADGGAGFEFRFTHYFGVFADARYVSYDKDPKAFEGRAGVKFTF